MTHSERLQHRIFGVLEEAGEDQIVTLINTVITPPRTSSELQALGSVLIDLTTDGMIEIAIGRNVMARENSVALLKELNSLVEWYPAAQAWRCREEEPCVEVFLTAVGTAMADRMLSQYGWPEGV